MKVLKIIALFVLCVVLLTVTFITMFSVSDTKTSSSEMVSSEITQSSSEESSSQVVEHSSSEESSKQDESTHISLVEGTVKTPLGELTVKSTQGLDTNPVTWGPGVQFNDKNQPTACVSLQEKYGDLGAVFLNSDKIYLTFDLGYESGHTAKILDTLKANNVKATFFVTGSYAKNQPELMQRIVDEGHTVGNHSWSHPDMTTISDDEAAAEITQVYDIVKQNYGYETYLFRFPAGVFSEKTLAIAAQNGHHSVFWSFAYNDWDNANQPDVTEALEKVTARLHPGAVYLLHPMETNSTILNDFIANAKNAGYEIGVF
ncbi:MAG: polysaccharide deacetylase family protein [Oscillospiraceae bacterium]|nr:polysaccharide deacetylase family protein [Oscillospiraceae bacterium]